MFNHFQTNPIMIRLASPLKLSAIWIKYDLIKYSIACAPCWILEDSWPQFTWSVTNGHFEHFNWKRTSNHPENKALRILKRNPSNIQLHASKSSFQNGRIQIAGKPPEVGSANPTTCREKTVARGHKKRGSEQQATPVKTWKWSDLSHNDLNFSWSGKNMEIYGNIYSSGKDTWPYGPAFDMAPVCTGQESNKSISYLCSDYLYHVFALDRLLYKWS